MLDNQWLLLLLRETRKKSGKIACSPPYTCLLYTSPAVALDTKMVVALRGKLARAGSALQQSLGQGDAGRDAVFVLTEQTEMLLHRQKHLSWIS